MGVLDALRMTRTQEQVADVTAALAMSADPSTFPYASPWAGDSHLERIVFQDAFPNGLPSNTRLDALAIPAISRARLMLVTSVSRMALVKLAAGQQVPRSLLADGNPNPDYADQLAAFQATQPTWLYRTNRTMPRQRTVWTVDDHLFYGWSCWWTDRSESDGFPLHTHRVNIGEWRVNADLKLEIQGKPVSDEQAILIPGYHEGILNFGREAIADAKKLYWIVRDRLANPVPMTELHQTGGTPLNKTERDDLVDHWRKSRTVEGGGVAFTNEYIELKTHGGDADATLLIEARNAAAVDMARLMGVSAGMLDATTPKASLTYETRTGRNQEFVDLDVNAYANPIEDRLSMDDMVPAGSRIAFDRGDLTGPTPSPTGPDLQD